MTTEPPPTQGAGSEGLTIQDRRKQLLEQQKQKKLKQKISMGMVSSASTANASESVVQVSTQRALLESLVCATVGLRILCGVTLTGVCYCGLEDIMQSDSDWCVLLWA